MKKYGKHTIWGWSWRTLMWVVLTPVLLFLLLFILLYLPPVQKWAVDTACERLSEETGMDVRVESVHLKFPLDLSMGGMVAIDDGDTLLCASTLDLSVRPRPLLDGLLEIDQVSLKETKLNSKELIEACEIQGSIGEVSFDSHSTDFSKKQAVINNALISDADLYIAMADSVSEDEEESAPFEWTAKVDDLKLHNVNVKVLLSPRADGSTVWANVADGHIANCFVDPLHSVYRADVDVKDLDFATNTIRAPHVCEAQMSVALDSLQLHVPAMSVRTDASDVSLSYKMDLNAFADTSPGNMSLTVDGALGKADIIQTASIGGDATVDVVQQMRESLSGQLVKVNLKADGNLRSLTLSDVSIDVPTLAKIDGDITLWNLIDDSLALHTDVAMQLPDGAKVDAVADYAMANDSYKVNADVRNLRVDNYLDTGDKTLINGKINASGRGFDFTSDNANCTLRAELDKSYYGTYNLSNIDADLTLRGHKVDLAMQCDNNQLKTQLKFNGEVTDKHVDGTLNIDLPRLDAKALGISDEAMTCSTTGSFDIYYDYDKHFRVQSNVDALNIAMADNNVVTESFDLFAEAMANETQLVLNTGDLSVDFYMPQSMFVLQPKINGLIQAAQQQAKIKKFNIDALKRYLPDVHINVNAGRNNPLYQFVEAHGIQFAHMDTKVNTSMSAGVSAEGHFQNLEMESVMVQSANFTIQQDSSFLRYDANVTCKEQTLLPALHARLYGYLGDKEADARLEYYDSKNKKGIDLGIHTFGTDTCHHAYLYPEHPIIGFQQYELNSDNYICMPRSDSPIIADVTLRSLADGGKVTMLAGPNAGNEQNVRLIIDKFNVGEMLSNLPIPGLPDVKGLLTGTVRYSVEDDAFRVYGNAAMEKLAYDGMDVGDVGSRFTYIPIGETSHGIDATLVYNGTQVADLQGTYNSAGNGSLNADAHILDIPMEMVSPFVTDDLFYLTGSLAGNVHLSGRPDALLFNGGIAPKDVHLMSPQYSVDLRMSPDTIRFNNSRINFDRYRLYSYDDNPLALNGYVDFSNLDKIRMSLNLTGNNFKLIESKRAPQKLVFGNLFGDVNIRINGTTDDISVRGRVRVLKSSVMTYIMSETPLSQGDRLDDIVTFVDLQAPVDTTAVREKKTYMGIDMNMNLVVEDGAKLRAELSTDRQSYVDVQGGGTLRMTLTPEGILSMMGRYTINQGLMKYALPVIPLRTFTIRNGSYVEFTGDPANPQLHITATERTRAAVSDTDGSSRSVTFDTGLRISKSLQDMGLEFVIEAPDDQSVQNELQSIGAEERNKLAVAMLATNLYISSSNSKNFTASNALNSFLQSEINNIAGKAFSTLVNVDVGMEQVTRDNGTTRTDYSFKFSRRFFSDRLNIVIGGKVNADGNTENNESAAYIDDVSLEWRLDDGGTQYVRLFHEKDYTNLIEGQLDKNGAGVLLRTKVDKFSDLYFWRKKEKKSSSR